jgi:nondiscriminating glutamyl-tRNA synthetase
MPSDVRVRFAPAPTGMMHLGNIRSALINALYAHHYNGTFVLRIEDTDTQRNYDPEAHEIRRDLDWLGLIFQEGPGAGGSYGPYFQSQRTVLYIEKLDELVNDKNNQYVYRCFCTEEELEHKRERQQALKLPPRYDRTCLHLTSEQVAQQLADHTPFIWRFKLDHTATVTIKDLAHGTMQFELKHFSDFPLTRQDGSVTFVFANCVDDILMKITHVFRGQEHLSNTACQAALYYAFDNPLPTYWHLPLLCNANGKKLSKRDFGFSLRDLTNEGFTPEAILNYLAIIGSSYAEEIMSFDELVKTIDLEHPPKTGYITYDVEKFRWVNRKWLERYTPEELFWRVRPFLQQYGLVGLQEDAELLKKQITQALQIAKTEMATLHDAVPLLKYIFEAPHLSAPEVLACIDEQQIPAIATVIKATLPTLDQGALYSEQLKTAAREQQIPVKSLFWFIRLALTGKTNGPAIPELVAILGVGETEKRLQLLLDTVTGAKRVIP